MPKIKIFRCLEIFLTIACLIITSFYIDKAPAIYLFIFLISSFIFLCILSLLEDILFSTKKKLDIIQLFFSVIFLMVFLDDIHDIEVLIGLGHIILIFLVVFLIRKIVSLFLKVKYIEHKKNNLHTLGVGIYSKEHNRKVLLAIFIPLLGFILLAVVFYKFISFSVILISIILYLLIVFILLVIVSKKELDKIIQYENDFDYEKMHQYFDYLFSNNLHPETKNYLISIKYIYESFIDNELAESLYKSLEKPKNTGYLFQYYSIKLRRIDNEEDFKREFSLMKNDAYFSKKNYQTAFEVLYDRQMTQFGKLRKTLDQVLPLKNNQTKLEYAWNLYYRAMYYKAINDQDNYLNTKELFLKDYGFLKVLSEKI